MDRWPGIFSGHLSAGSVSRPAALPLDERGRRQAFGCEQRALDALGRRKPSRGLPWLFSPSRSCSSLCGPAHISAPYEGGNSGPASAPPLPLLEFKEEGGRKSIAASPAVPGSRRPVRSRRASARVCAEGHSTVRMRRKLVPHLRIGEGVPYATQAHCGGLQVVSRWTCSGGAQRRRREGPRYGSRRRLEGALPVSIWSVMRGSWRSYGKPTISA